MHLPSGATPPDLADVGRFCAVVVIEDDVTAEWRHRVTDHLYRSGCRYLLAWGRECSLWDDSMDWTNMEAFDFGDIPDEDFVMTTWRDDEPLSEVFWFCKNCAQLSPIDLPQVVILHVSAQPREAELPRTYEQA